MKKLLLLLCFLPLVGRAQYPAGGGPYFKQGGTVVSTNFTGNGINITNIQGQNIFYPTNASDSVLMPVGKYSTLITNNNVVLANLFLSGTNWSPTGVNWSSLYISNNSAATITFLVPNTCHTADGARTYYITNEAWFSAVNPGGLRGTNGVCRNNFW